MTFWRGREGAGRVEVVGAREADTGVRFGGACRVELRLDGIRGVGRGGGGMRLLVVVVVLVMAVIGAEGLSGDLEGREVFVLEGVWFGDRLMVGRSVGVGGVVAVVAEEGEGFNGDVPGVVLVVHRRLEGFEDIVGDVMVGNTSEEEEGDLRAEAFGVDGESACWSSGAEVEICGVVEGRAKAGGVGIEASDERRCGLSSLVLLSRDLAALEDLLRSVLPSSSVGLCGGTILVMSHDRVSAGSRKKKRGSDATSIEAP